MPATERAVAFHRDFRTPDSIKGLATKLMWGREIIINKELQFYIDPEWAPKWTPFTFGPEGLTITAQETPEEHRETGMPYVSGVLTSNGREPFGQQYGRFTLRARLPHARGAWPGWWLLPMDWSALKEEHPEEDVLPEIDIMEAVADVVDGVYHATAHSRDGHGSTLVASGERIRTGADLVGEFHDYGLEWTAEHLVWLFDDREVRRIPTPADMHDVRHWICNLAVGGWGGTPDPADYPARLVVESITVLAPLEGDGGIPDEELAAGIARTERWANWLTKEPDDTEPGMSARAAAVIRDRLFGWRREIDPTASEGDR